eukprot:107991_1
MSQEVTIMSAYMVLFLFFLAAFILLALIIHLIFVAHKKIKNTSRSNRCSNKAILGIIIVTLVGILSFFISVLLLIATVIQLLLIDSKTKSGDDADGIAYSFQNIEYLTVIFDQFGHLSMLTVFVIRLKICFEASVYGFSKAFMRFMYCCLILLMVGSFVIIMQIANHSNVETIIVSEIIWELATEGMMLWILYLFVSKLQSLVKMGLGRSRRNLRMTISYNISQKSKSRENSRNHSRNNSVRTNKSRTDVTMDRVRSPSPSPSPRSPSPIPNPRTKPKPNLKPNQTVLNSQNLVNVMTKMTLLVLIAVFGSIFSMIANIYIEVIELQTTSQETAHIGTMWANVLPVFDMVLASFMLYLQFDFTKNVYNKMCSKWDILFIQFCGDLLSKKTANEQKDKKKDTVLSGSNASSIKKPRTPTTPSATSPRAKRLTLDITQITTENTVTAFTPPSPSPSPIAESNAKPVSFQNAIRNNIAIQIKRPPLPPRAPPITPRSASPSPRKTQTVKKGGGSGKINVSFWENAIASSSPKS